MVFTFRPGAGFKRARTASLDYWVDGLVIHSSIGLLPSAPSPAHVGKLNFRSASARVCSMYSRAEK
jgi:hypothetical protein